MHVQCILDNTEHDLYTFILHFKHDVVNNYIVVSWLYKLMANCFACIHVHVGRNSHTVKLKKCSAMYCDVRIVISSTTQSHSHTHTHAHTHSWVVVSPESQNTC